LILVTGAAGFIGRHVAEACLRAGHEVFGVDNLNSYYDPGLKRARLESLRPYPGFRFAACDLAEPGALEQAVPAREARVVIHLAAQAGVRYSLSAPFAYERSNVAGHLAVLEYCRAAPNLTHLVYASSSSVYGDRAEGPFREDDRTDSPASLYAATKKSCELMSETYARLYGLPQTGLRFFTVYGPWGRPDMAYWMFTEALLEGRPITLFGEGKLARDFTAIEDVAPIVARIAHSPPSGAVPHAIYNIGNSNPNTVEDLVRVIERAVGRPAVREMAPAQPGDVTVTFADCSRAAARFGFEPRVTIQDGIPRFVDWLREYRRGLSR